MLTRSARGITAPGRGGLPSQPLLVAFTKFGGLSGLGWLSDTAILLCLVQFAGLAPFAANLISSGIAALGVFLISRKVIFARAPGRIGLRVAAYLAYIVLMICVASVGMRLVAEWTKGLSDAYQLALPAVVMAAFAKVVVTPPQLVLNFLVSRFIIERWIRPKSPAHG